MRRTILLVGALLLTMPPAPDTQEADEPPPAALIFYGGQVLTLDPKLPVAEALAVAEGRILALGTEAEIMALRGPDTTVINLKGGALLPALKDHHLHLLNIGFSLLNRERNQALFLDLSGTRSAEEVAQHVAARAATLDPPGWILGKGWSQEAWTDRTLPTHHLLTQAAPEHPVFLTRVDGHCGWANARALQLAGLTAETPDPPGGAILRLDDGAPSGVLLERANEPLLEVLPPPSDDDITAAFRLAARTLAAQGLTEVHDAGFLAVPGIVAMNVPFERTLELLRRLDEKEPLPLQVNLMIPAPSPFADKVRRDPALRALSPRLRITHIKLFADGALGSRGAALSHPYADDPGTRGVFRMTAEELKDEAERALDAGLDVATHAIGDAAVARTLDIYEEVLAARPKLSLRRLRVEHFSYASSADIERAARLGVLVVVQPGFVYPGPDGRTMEDARLGEKPSANAYAWKRLTRRGAVLAGSSDDFNIPLHPLWNYYAAVTRQSPEGTPPDGWHPEERLERDAALRLFTRVYSSGADSSSGQLRPGELADLVILSGNPLTVEATALLNLRVQATFHHGAQTYPQ